MKCQIFFFNKDKRNVLPTKLILAALVANFMILSCAMKVSPEPKLPAAIFLQYPLTIHFYSSPEFKNAVVSPLYGYEIELGQASIQAVTETLGVIFKNLIPINGLTNLPTNFIGVVEPLISHFNFDLDTEVMEVAYSFKIYDERKQIIETINVSGRSKRDAYRDLIVTNFLKERAEKAIIDAMAQFMLAFKTNPKIQTWLAANGIKQKT